MMIERLKAIFRQDDFVPSSSVFPSIDSDKIQRDLKLSDIGKERGAANQPPPDAKEFDHIETSIIERIEEVRRKGLENYETNRRIYNERLARAGQASQEVEIVVGIAQGDFGAMVQDWQSKIEAARDRLNGTFTWRDKYMVANKLDRPAKHFEGWVKVGSLAIIMIVCESIINSYLFAQGNEFGLVGGVLAAGTVSLVNVGISTLLGFLSRFSNRRQVFWKLFGVLAVLVWLGFFLTMNLAVAHFRDALEAGRPWRDAAREAITALMAHPFQLDSIESWLLTGIGALISILAFIKGLHIDDPYPGYGAVERSLAHARDTYSNELNNALEDLKDRRDEAIAELQDANEQVRQGISEAVDALFGQSSLNGHLKTFLEQCDIKTGHLLATYRDANRAVRNEPAPKVFDRAYRFAAFKTEVVDTSRRADAEAEAARVGHTVEAAIKEMFARFEAARQTFDVTRAVQRDANPDPRSM